MLRRDRLRVRDRDQILNYVATISVTDAIFTAAEAITSHVRTLDAIHLASALVLGGDTTMVSHDSNVREVADHLGIRVLDPLENVR